VNPFAEIVILGCIGEETTAFMPNDVSDPESNISAGQWSKYRT
jgi:hypothetical protein